MINTYAAVAIGCGVVALISAMGLLWTIAGAVREARAKKLAPVATSKQRLQNVKSAELMAVYHQAFKDALRDEEK